MMDVDTSTTNPEAPELGSIQVSPSVGSLFGIPHFFVHQPVYRSPVKVLICGPRNWLEQRPVEDVLRLLPKGTTVIHGGAPGVDMIAGFVAKDILGLRVRSYPVDHALDGPWPGAGPRRNERMLNSEHPGPDGHLVDLGLSFKRQEALTAGTRSMSGLMRSRDVPVMEILWTKGSWAKTLELLDLFSLIPELQRPTTKN